jgi:CO/xanthine dehydrogenase FAD-binding subunit
VKPAVFELARPRTLENALALLAAHAADAKLPAGGQTLVPVMNLRLATPRILIDLNTVTGLAGIRLEGERLHIGAMTRQAELLRDPLVCTTAPLLEKAARYIGHVQTRSRGTVGGSLAHADPAAELPLIMVALEATFTLRSKAGERSLPAYEFFRGALTTALRPDEMLTEIAVPVAARGTRASFRELSRRHGDFAIVAAAAQRSEAGVTLAVGGLEAVPRRLDPERVAAQLAAAQPLDDLHASAEYRRHLACVLVQECLAEVGAA